MESRTSEDRKSGLIAGRRWAETNATPDELQRLASLLDRWDEDDSDGFVSLEHYFDISGASGFFVYAIRDTSPSDEPSTRQFWQEQGLTADLSPAFVTGFAEAALCSFEQTARMA